MFNGIDKEDEKVAAPDDTDCVSTREKMELFDWLECIVTAVVCGIFIFVFIGRVIGVEQTSMLPTLYDHDKVIMTKFLYKPKNGDIVVFKSNVEAYGNSPFVKRIIAVEGQTLDINFETGEVFLDGVVIDEPYINALTLRQDDFKGPVTIPEGYVFVMGDNRNYSLDSRSESVGLIDTRTILGKVLLIVIPGRDSAGTREWSRIGSVYN